MNQIFRITIGQETVAGKLPSLRVGQGYNSLFHISGVGSDSVSPKVWVSIADNTYFWEGEWDNTLGLWVICVGSGATQIKGIYSYAITMGGETSESPTYIAGQGMFVVYANITTSTGEHGTDGTSLLDLIASLQDQINALDVTAGISVDSVSIPAGANTVHINVDVAEYELVTAFVVMPNDATARYSVSMIRADDTGFVVALSSTVLDVGYSINYTIRKKG